MDDNARNDDDGSDRCGHRSGGGVCDVGTAAGFAGHLRCDRVRGGAAHAVALNSCTAALHLALVVLGVERTNLHKKIRAYGVKRGEKS